MVKGLHQKFEVFILNRSRENHISKKTCQTDGHLELYSSFAPKITFTVLCYEIYNCWVAYGHNIPCYSCYIVCYWYCQEVSWIINFWVYVKTRSSCRSTWHPINFNDWCRIYVSLHHTYMSGKVRNIYLSCCIIDIIPPPLISKWKI